MGLRDLFDGMFESSKDDDGMITREYSDGGYRKEYSDGIIEDVMVSDDGREQHDFIDPFDGSVTTISHWDPDDDDYAPESHSFESFDDDEDDLWLGLRD